MPMVSLLFFSQYIFFSILHVLKISFFFLFLHNFILVTVYTHIYKEILICQALLWL